MRSLFLCPALWYNETKPFTEQENHHAQGFTGRSLRPHRFYPHRAPACPGRGVFVCLRGLRLLLPGANLPATTALATVDSKGRQQAVLAGANVIMPNLSPAEVRDNYSLYDHKAVIQVLSLIHI